MKTLGMLLFELWSGDCYEWNALDTVIQQRWEKLAVLLDKNNENPKLEGIKDGMRRAEQIVVSGRFLHDEAPTYLFAKEVSKAILSAIDKQTL